MLTFLPRFFFRREKGPVTLLDIGSDFLKAICLDEDFRLKTIDFLPIPQPEAEIENLQDSREFLIIEGIRRLFVKHPDFPKKTYSVLSDRSVFVRVMRFFPLAKKELEKAIRYEAKLQVPFAIEKAKIDYFILGSVLEKKIKKLEVLLIVVSQEVIDSHLKLLEKAELTPAVIDLSTLAYWRLFFFSYPQLLGKTAAFIDLGASKSEINIFKKGNLCFSRFIPIGGQDFTRMIKEELVVDFAEAEKIKREYGSAQQIFLDLEEAKKQIVKRVYDALSSLLFQFASDLRRTFEFYLTQYPDSPVEQIILTGGSSLIAGFEDFLSDNLGKIPVEKFKFKEVFPLSPALDKNSKELLKNQETLVLLGPALALSTWPQSKAKLNLAPTKKSREKSGKFNFFEEPILRWILILVVFFVLTMLSSLFWVSRLKKSTSGKLQQAQNMLAALQSQKTGSAEEIKKKVALAEEISRMTAMVKKRVPLNEAMEVLSIAAPVGVFLEQVNFDYRTKQLEIIGRAASSEAVNNFLINLNKGKNFPNLELVYIREISEVLKKFNKSFKIVGSLGG